MGLAVALGMRQARPCYWSQTISLSYDNAVLNLFRYDIHERWENNKKTFHRGRDINILIRNESEMGTKLQCNISATNC